jgi:acylphosphatase
MEVLHVIPELVTMAQMAQRAHVLISGRVQGVNFRAAAQRYAQPLGVDGYIRNLPDGRVEAVFEGEDATVQQAIDWCHDGPPAAHVDDVEVDWQPPTGEFRGFSIRG